MRIENFFQIKDSLGNAVYLSQDELDQLVAQYTFIPRPWTKEEMEALDAAVSKNAEVELSTEESPDGCAKQHLCYAGCDCFRSHI
jgi:hypothetical protein